MPAVSRQRKRLWLAVRVLAIAGVIALLWVFLRGIDFGALKTALLRAEALPLLLAAILNFTNIHFNSSNNNSSNSFTNNGSRFGSSRNQRPSPRG